MFTFTVRYFDIYHAVNGPSHRESQPVHIKSMTCLHDQFWGAIIGGKKVAREPESNKLHFTGLI